MHVLHTYFLRKVNQEQEAYSISHRLCCLRKHRKNWELPCCNETWFKSLKLNLHNVKSRAQDVFSVTVSLLFVLYLRYGSLHCTFSFLLLLTFHALLCTPLAVSGLSVCFFVSTDAHVISALLFQLFDGLWCRCRFFYGNFLFVFGKFRIACILDLITVCTGEFLPF